MGKLKQAQLKKEEENEPDMSATILDSEFKYLMSTNFMINQISDLLRQIMSGYLYNIATSRLGYEGDKNLRFELDFEDENKQLKIWEADESLYSPIELESPERP